MPPPQCPECGRFLATAFVEQIKTEPAPCPGCGAALLLDPEDGAPTSAAAPVSEDVAPEPETSVRPPDQRPVRDPLEGWDESGTFPPPAAAAPDPTVLAAGAGIGLLLGLLLGGRQHRTLGALLGAVLGAAVARLRD